MIDSDLLDDMWDGLSSSLIRKKEEWDEVIQTH